MHTIIVLIHIVACCALIGLVLLQQGKGTMSPFGGASQTLFGSRGAANFLTRSTAVSACVFFLTSLTLSYMAAHADDRMAQAVAQVQRQLPVDQDVPDVPIEPAHNIERAEVVE